MRNNDNLLKVNNFSRMNSIDNSDVMSEISENNSKIHKSYLRAKSTIMLDANEKAFRQQLFEMNNYPKCLIMTDKDLDIVF